MDYPLYRAFKKYGIKNFNFIILEECDIDSLNNREIFWINKIHPEYNQTFGGNYKVVPKKLTDESVKDIKKLLVDNNNTHVEIAKQFHVSIDTIRDINVGRTWYDDSTKYPIHISRFDGTRTKQKVSLCPICKQRVKGKENKICNECKKRDKLQKKFYKANSRIIKKIIKQKRKEINKIEQRKSVKQLSKDGKYIQSFDSIADAVRFLIMKNECSKNNPSGARSHISDVCRGKRKSAYGYRWEYYHNQ